MVVVEQQHVLLAIHRKQPGPQQQTRRQIKRRAALLLQPLLDHILSIPLAQRFPCQGKGCRRVNDLNHLAPLQLERGAQG